MDAGRMPTFLSKSFPSQYVGIARGMPLPAEVFLEGHMTRSIRANSCSLKLLSLYKMHLRIVGEDEPFTVLPRPLGFSHPLCVLKSLQLVMLSLPVT